LHKSDETVVFPTPPFPVIASFIDFSILKNSHNNINL